MGEFYKVSSFSEKLIKLNPKKLKPLQGKKQLNTIGIFPTFSTPKHIVGNNKILQNFFFPSVPNEIKRLRKRE